MMNLFSIFDPISYYNLQINWIILFVIFMFSIMKYYWVKSSIYGVKYMFLNVIGQMFKEIGGVKSMGVVFVVLSTFIYLVITNFLGLFPFIFTSTAHPMITMSMGFIFWFSFFLMGWVCNFSESAAHLVPEGSPLGLAPFMVLIESISHLMRPFTLSIRLAANMMAGHLIISLLSSISMINFLSLSISIFFQSMLLILELGVALIQGFVFSILLLLYCLEYY